MLFNHTKKPVVICSKSELKENILNALTLTKKIICKRQGSKVLTHADGLNEKARNGHTKLSIFKYLDAFEKKFKLDEVWLNRVYELADTDPKKSKELFHEILPEYSKFSKITLNDARGLRTDLKLFLHCCWASKFLLLPTTFGDLPKQRLGKNSPMKEYADDAYPEILRIIRAPFFEKLECEVDITKYMPKASLKNFMWYAHRYVRACAAWEVEDITNELLKEITSNPVKGVTRTVDWYFALHASLPNRVQFDTDNVFVRNGISGLKGKLSADNFNPIELKQHPAIPAWIKDVNEYIDTFRESEKKSYHKYQSTIRKGMQILMASGEPLPFPKDIKRTHAKVIAKGLGLNIAPSTHKQYLYQFNSFLDYLAMIYDDFKKPWNKKLDFPRVGRSKGTVKELVHEDCFVSYLSYLYGVAEWIWYMNHHHPYRNNFVRNISSEDRTIKTAETGFIPIMRCNGKYYPIDEIPTQIASPLRPRKNQICQLKSCTFLPHYVHLSIVMAETGIRLIALRFLDEQTYDKNVNRDIFDEHSYLITKLWVNSDKSHDAWEADVYETVIGILDRQSLWKNTFLNGEDAPIYYDGHNESSFDMLRPLFAQVDPYLRIRPSFAVVTDQTYRKVFKYALTHFSYVYSKISKENITPVLINHDKNLEENLQRVKDFVGKNALLVTPHSMRSQVVSDFITVLPPSIIKKTTGHMEDSSVIYYAQIKPRYLNIQKAAQEEEFKDFIAPMMVDTKSEQSALQQAFAKNANTALKDFGAISLTSHNSTAPRNGMLIIKQKLETLDDNPDGTLTIVDLLAFNSTHICPFNNECPPDIQQDSIEGHPPCGRCPCAIKTVDNLPAISAKIRTLTDKASEHEEVINEAKERGEDMKAYMSDITLKKFYSDEISAWATSMTCLESMAHNLSQNDKWLVGEPEFIRSKLTKLKSSNELTNTLIRIEEAVNYNEFLTPQLKARVTLLRNKVLAQTGQFKALLGEVPTGSDLLSEFKGIIKSICDVTGIGVNDLPHELKKIEANAHKALKDSLILPASPSGRNDA
ncbi:hypothetical protein Q8E16_002706 [Vibrio alginolyticus]|nr:hypothetical protein [Vibrio alginolyticus]